MKNAILGLTLTIAPLIPQQAMAQGTQAACAARDAIIERLESKWGESFAGGGLQSASSVFEIWMSPEKGTWTILRTSANGTACVMATGTNWRIGGMTEEVSGIKG